MKLYSSIQSSANAILRFANSPAYHLELTHRLGSPSTCFAFGDRKGDATQDTWESSLWALESPLGEFADVRVHLAWAAEFLDRYRDYIEELVRAGVEISLHLACHAEGDFTLFTLEPQLLLPFAHLGIPIEIYTAMP